jgi:perosamine synthetase
LSENAFIPLCVPQIAGNEWAYVKDCLDTNWVSSVGSYVDRFEADMAAFVGARHAVATSSGTAALHVALLVAGVRADDEVMVSSMTFIAPANVIRYVGAWPVFVDADEDYWQLDPVKVARFIDEECESRGGELWNKSTGRRVSAIVPVHILGHPVEMGPIMELARAHGLRVIEDATESFGARYEASGVGTIGDIACLSFNGNKLMTTGGGGMILTANEEWARRARHLTTQAKAEPIEYVHDEIGFNYRLTNMLAAMGCAQVEQLGEFIESKRATARGYAEQLREVPGITLMPEAPWASSVSWMYTVLVDADEFGMDSRALLQALDAQRIQTRPLWQPMHLSAAHAGALATDCSVAERLYRDALSLPCSTDITESQVDAVASAIIDAHASARSPS